MQIHLKTLGCRLNEAELENWAQAFQRAGHRITRDPNQANLVVINSCAVTRDAARKSKQLIRRVHRDNPTAKLVVSGCYATLNEQEAARLLGVDLIVSNRDKTQLVEKTLAALNWDTMPAMSTEPGETSLFSRGRQRAFVKVQDGCRYRCTFCIVTVARGTESSKPIADVISEINTLHNQGINEVILTGVHLGGYGSDTGSCLVELIERILADTQIPRLRLGSLEPWELPDHFFALFENPRLMPHLHLPLQSGCDSVLKRMARRCKTAEFSQIVERARESVPHFNITTDIIVGFPGETELEWKQGLDYINTIGFGHIHIFTYSRRESTRAAALPGQLGNAVKKRRSQALHRYASAMKQAFMADNAGLVFPVLWEGHVERLNQGKIRQYGYTPNYLRVACELDAPVNITNQIIPAKLLRPKDNYMSAALLR